MISIIGALVLVLAMIAAIAKYLSAWWNEEEQQERIASIINYQQSLAATKTAAIKLPLYIANALLCAIFGAPTYSRISIYRIIIMSLIILIGCLGIAGLFNSTTLGIELTPWSAYEQELTNMKIREVKILQQGQGADFNILSEEKLALIDTLSQPHIKFLYSALLICLVVLLNIIADVFAFTFTRKVLSDLLDTDSPVLITGALLLSLVFCLVVASIVILIVSVVTNPTVMITTILVSMLPEQWSLLTLGLWVTNILFAWYDSSIWVSAVAVSAVLPSAILLALTTLSLILYPFRQKLSGLIREVLERSIKHEKGPLLYFSVISASIAAMLAILLKIIN